MRFKARYFLIILVLLFGCAQEAGIFPREELPNLFPIMNYTTEINTVWNGECVNYEREYENGEDGCAGRIIFSGCASNGSGINYYKRAVSEFEEAGVGLEEYAEIGEYGVADTNVSAGDAIIFFRNGAIVYVETRYCPAGYAQDIAGKIDESLVSGG